MKGLNVIQKPPDDLKFKELLAGKHDSLCRAWVKANSVMHTYKELKSEEQRDQNSLNV